MRYHQDMTGGPQVTLEIGEPELEPQQGGMAALIVTLARRSRGGKTVSLGDAIDLAGSRIHGVAILLLALPETLPIPVPSIGVVLAIPLAMLAAHLVAFGEHGTLPSRIRRTRFPAKVLLAMERYLTGPLSRAEQVSFERWPGFARQERLIGVACLLMSILLFMPVPLMNMLPALAMVSLSWGLIQKDGLFVAIGLLASLLITVGTIAFADFLIDMVRRLI